MREPIGQPPRHTHSMARSEPISLSSSVSNRSSVSNERRYRPCQHPAQCKVWGHSSISNESPEHLILRGDQGHQQAEQAHDFLETRSHALCKPNAHMIQTPGSSQGHDDRSRSISLAACLAVLNEREPQCESHRRLQQRISKVIQAQGFEDAVRDSHVFRDLCSTTMVRV